MNTGIFSLSEKYKDCSSRHNFTLNDYEKHFWFSELLGFGKNN